MADTFHCSVITPERAVLESEATFVAFPAWDGEVGILARRAPLVTRIGAGLLRVETAEGRRALFVAGGFAQMVGNRLTILTEQAKEPAEIDRAGAERALAEAKAMPGRSDAEFKARQQALASARRQVQLAGAKG